MAVCARFIVEDRSESIRDAVVLREGAPAFLKGEVLRGRQAVDRLCALLTLLSERVKRKDEADEKRDWANV